MTARLHALGRLVVVAVAVALMPAWVPLRVLIVLPVLVLVAGWSATVLVLGPRRNHDDPLRVLLPVLLGVLSLFLAVIMLLTLRVGLGPVAVPVATGTVAMVLLLATPWRGVKAGVRGYPLMGLASYRSRIRPALTVAAAVLVLGAAVTGAAAMQPQAVEQYTQLSIDDTEPHRGLPLTARSGGRVALHWTLRSHGYPLTDPAPAVQLSIGDLPATWLNMGANPPTASPVGAGSTSTQVGETGFAAPARPGLYRVQISVAPTGTPDTGPWLATIVLQVVS